VIARDITAKKKAEAELSAYRCKMTRVERLASLGTFSATLAHELTQPLTVLCLSIDNCLGALQAMSSGSVETLVEELQVARRAVEKIVFVAGQLRGFGRRNAEHILQKVDLNVVAGDAVRLLDWPARQSRITLCVQGMDRFPPVYLRNDIEQVFFALIQNAIQAADGKTDHHLTIRGALHHGHIELRFVDDCGGISPEHLARVFDPFFTTKPNPVGTGLGLPIVQQIVQENQGQVRVENQPGAGVTFVVSLPVGCEGRS
jgi:two-component system C4-dicarboxylate transport sensor histidine kinase DctB